MMKRQHQKQQQSFINVGSSSLVHRRRRGGGGGDTSISSMISSTSSKRGSNYYCDYNSTTTTMMMMDNTSSSYDVDELTSVSQYSVMSEHDISKLESYISKCIEELPVETPDLLFAGRKSTMLLQSLLRIFLFDNEYGHTGGNSITKAKDMPSGGVMVVFPTQNNEVKQTLLIVRDKDLAKEVAVKCGAIESVIRLMRTFKDSPRYQSKAVELLGILADGIPEHQEFIAREHGISFILAVLLHPQISKESRICLDAIRSLARICTPSCKVAISQLIDSCDGIQIIDKIIKKHCSSSPQLQEEILKLLVNVVSYSEVRPEPTTLQATGETTSSRLLASNGSSEDDDEDDNDGLCYPFLQYVEDPDLIENLMKHIISKFSSSKSSNNKSTSLLDEKMNDLSFVLIHKLAHKGKRMGTRNALVRKKAIPVIIKCMIQSQYYELTKACALKQLHGLQTLYSCAKERPEARETIASSSSSDSGGGIIAIFDAMYLSYRLYPNMTIHEEEEQDVGSLSIPTMKKVIKVNDCSPVSIPKKSCQLLQLLLKDDRKSTSKTIAKYLKKDVKYRDMLKDYKTFYPNECSLVVDQIIEIYNKQYGF